MAEMFLQFSPSHFVIVSKPKFFGSIWGVALNVAFAVVQREHKWPPFSEEVESHNFSRNEFFEMQKISVNPSYKSIPLRFFCFWLWRRNIILSGRNCAAQKIASLFRYLTKLDSSSILTSIIALVKLIKIVSAIDAKIWQYSTYMCVEQCHIHMYVDALNFGSFDCYCSSEDVCKGSELRWLCSLAFLFFR